MSYILDALRKSEEARRRQLGPDLSLADAAPAAERRGSSKTLTLLALALLVNGGVLGLWLLRSGDPETTPAALPARPGAESSGASTIPSAPPAAAPGPAATATLPPQPSASSITTAPGPAPAAADSESGWRRQPVQRISDLAPGSRSRLPDLAISTHIYAEEPEYREVSINGRRYQEGDSVAGLPLLEITTAGVLLGFEGQVIRLDLQEAWGL